MNFVHQSAIIPGCSALMLGDKVWFTVLKVLEALDGDEVRALGRPVSLKQTIVRGSFFEFELVSCHVDKSAVPK